MALKSDPTPTPAPSSTYGFPSVSPLVGGASGGLAGGSQGDIPYAQPGPRNTMFGYTDQPKISAGYQAQIPLVGWSLGAPRAGTGLAGLNQAAGYATQGGQNYYSLSATLQAWGQLTPDQRVTVQKQLLASGKYSDAYYPSGTSNVPSKQPAYGAVADYDTIKALSDAWNAASDTGQTLDTVLNAHDAAARNAARIYQQNTQVGIFDQSSASELRSIADQQAVAVLGRKATADEKTLLVSMEQGRQVAYQQGQFNQRVGAARADVATQLAGGIGGTLGAPGSNIAGGATPSTVNALVSALGGQETTSPTPGGYTTVNPDSGATGRFQIMPGNWPSWSQAAGLGPNAPMTPQNQEIVARNQISIYLANGHGDPAYVAVAWYSGEDTAKAFQADPTNPKWKVPIGVSGKPDPKGKYPSIASYAQSIAGKMAAVVPGTLATQSMAGNVGNLPATPPTPGQGNVDPNYPYPAGVGGIAAAGAAGGSVPLSSGQSSAGGSVPFGPGLNAQGQSTLPPPGTTQVPGGTITGGQPTPAQLLPTSTGIYTQVNTGTDIAEYLRQQNPQGAGAHDLAQVLDAVRQLFHG